MRQSSRQDTTSSVQDTVMVAAFKRIITAEMKQRYIEGSNTYLQLRSRVAVGETMIQESHAPMDSGEVDREIEGSDVHIDEMRSIRRPRRDERSTPQRGQGKQPQKAPPSGRQERREVDNGHDSGKKTQAMMCYSCGGQGHPARLCPTPSDHALSPRKATPTVSRRGGCVRGRMGMWTERCRRRRR